MLQFLLRRCVAAVPVVLLVTLVAFMIINLLPGDVAFAILGENRARDSGAYQALRAELGLDRPFLVRYLDWLASAVEGDLGTSLRTREPVTEAVGRRVSPTLHLIVGAALFAVPLGIASGILSATTNNRLVRGFSTVLTLCGVCVPNFWLGMLLVIVFSLWLGWLPPSGFVPVWEDPQASLQRMLMPGLALGTALLAIVQRQTRSALLEVLGEDYVRTAHSKGLPPLPVMSKHVLRNALLPVITVVGLQLGRLFGGAVTVEIVFSIPGMGRLAVDSIYFRDFPVLLGIMILLALAVVLANLVVDVLYVVVDPRIRTS